MFLFRHYSVPTIPSLPGKEKFEGLFMHSHSYRHPEVLQDLAVLCLGAGPSGTDIALEIAPFCKQVRGGFISLLSHNKRVVKVKVWFYIAQYTLLWTAQSALPPTHPTLADLFILVQTRLLGIVFMTSY